MKNYTYSFPATKALSFNKATYQAAVPLRAFIAMLKLDDDSDVNTRSQRLVNMQRAKAFANYILQNKNKESLCVVPTLVGVIEGDHEFVEVPLDGFMLIGRLDVQIDSKVRLFDGQHRAVGLKIALEKDSSIANQMVTLMLYSDLSLVERKQAFHDINYTPSKPPAALCITYNAKAEEDRILLAAVRQSAFRAHTDYERNTCSGSNENLYSIKSLKSFAENLLGKKYEYCNKDSAESLLVDALNAFEEVVKPLKLMSDCREPKLFRDEYIIGHNVTLQAIALLMCKLMTKYPDEYRDKLAPLSNHEILLRDNPALVGRCVTDRLKMTSNQRSVRLTAYYLMSLCGLTLSPDEKQEESEFINEQISTKKPSAIE